MNESVQVNIDLTQKNLLRSNNILNKSRNKIKLSPIVNFHDYLNTLNYYRNREKFHGDGKIFFTNEEIISHFNNDEIKPNKKNLLIKLKKPKPFDLNIINNSNYVKNKSFKKQINNQLFFNVETNVNTISHVNSNLSINKVNFNISKTFSNEQDPYKLIEIKRKIKKIRFQAYNKYNINQRNKLKLKKSYSSEKKIEIDSNLQMDIKKCNKPNNYFDYLNLNKNTKNIKKYIDAKSQIKSEPV